MIEPEKQKGLLAWFARNHVAANLLMLLILVAGAISLMRNTVEIFPETSVDIITVEVPYLGAAPEEAEEGVVLRVEEAVAGIDGVKRVRGTAMEGMGLVLIEVDDYAETREVLDDVKAEVDRITTFPRETEKPIITEITIRNHVISIVLSGDVPERTLKELAERMRDELTAKPNITQVDVAGARNYEISIEVSEETLRRYNLSFERVAQAVAAASLDLPGGSVKTEGGEILIRTKGQRYRGPEFENIVVLTRPGGTRIRLGDIAEVKDAFEDSDLVSYFDGQRSVQLQVYRVGDQNLLDVVDTVYSYIEDKRGDLPAGVSINTWMDNSEYLRSRMELLVKNAAFGLVLVFFVLSLFLDLRLAFWTTLGIPISFMGAFWLMPYADTTINMMSLFAFILALGIVVDDAIVVGENIFEYLQQGYRPVDAAVKGVREMASPVVMAVLTTIFAFMPLLFVYGIYGKFIRVIPIVVISILSVSLVEALLILPAHLAGGRHRYGKGHKPGPVARFQGFIRTRLDNFVRNRFIRFVDLAVSWRYVTVAAALAVLLLAIGYVQGGFIKFSLMPSVEADNVWASLSMPQGTDVEQTRRVVERIEAAAERVREKIDAERLEILEEEPDQFRSVFEHIATSIGEQPFTSGEGGGPPVTADTGSHAAEVNIQLLESEHRGGRYSSEKIEQMWRDEVGEIPGVSSLTFSSSLFHGGNAIEVELSHYNFDQLLQAADNLKETLDDFPGVYDIADSFETGKMELKLQLKDTGRLLGLTVEDLARQVRQGFYGYEVQRVQRGREDIRVMVRYPEEQRRSLADVERMRIRLPDGTEVPFEEVAEVDLGRGYATISRADQRRIVSVTASVDQAVVTSNEVNDVLRARTLPALQEQYPGLIYNFEGEQKIQGEIAASLGASAAIALMAIFALLAVQFRSYSQPAIIMSAIPFGLIGALIGHIVMSLYYTAMQYFTLGIWQTVPFNFSILSIFGIVALTGIVVNDSLIMIDLINNERTAGVPLKQIVQDSVLRRFRPIMLTTLTTFFGLVPMMLEQSLQARFLIPMAVSLAFGVLFATMITLILVPSLYMILEDVHRVTRRTVSVLPGVDLVNDEPH